MTIFYSFHSNYFCSYFLVTLFLRVPLGQRESFTEVTGVVVLVVHRGSQFPVTLFLRVPLPHRVINLTAFSTSGSISSGMIPFFLSFAICLISFL